MSSYRSRHPHRSGRSTLTSGWRGVAVGCAGLQRAAGALAAAAQRRLGEGRACAIDGALRADTHADDATPRVRSSRRCAAPAQGAHRSTIGALCTQSARGVVLRREDRTTKYGSSTHGFSRRDHRPRQTGLFLSETTSGTGRRHKTGIRHASAARPGPARHRDRRCHAVRVVEVGGRGRCTRRDSRRLAHARCRKGAFANDGTGCAHRQ